MDNQNPSPPPPTTPKQKHETKPNESFFLTTYFIVNQGQEKYMLN